MYRNYSPYYSQQLPQQNQAFRPAAYGPGIHPSSQVTAEETTVFRKPGQDYAANSFMGYHAAVASSAAALNHWGPQPHHPVPPASSSVMTEAERRVEAASYHSGWSLSRPELVSTDSGYPSTSPFQHSSSPGGSAKAPASFVGEGSRSLEEPRRGSRWKLCLVIAILVIIVAVLVAMAVAVYSQVRTTSSVIKLIRQYDASFLVTDGPLLDFNPQLLIKDSPQFNFKAQIFEQKMDSLLRQSGLSSVYEGSEVSAFRFVVAVPALEVHFLLKTKVDADLRVQDLLTVLHQGLESDVGARVFGDEARVEPASLTVEGEKLQGA